MTTPAVIHKNATCCPRCNRDVYRGSEPGYVHCLHHGEVWVGVPLNLEEPETPAPKAAAPLTDVTLALLRAIAAAPGRYVRDYAVWLDEPRHSIDGRVSTLATRGFIEREHDVVEIAGRGRRASGRLHISAEGRAYLARVAAGGLR